MPYIAFNTSKPMTPEQREAVKTELGRLISILPTKSESGLMIDFSDSRPMYFRGLEAPSCAFMDVRLFGKSDNEAKKQFVGQVFRMVEHILGIKSDEMFLNIVELDQWASSGGVLRFVE